MAKNPTDVQCCEPVNLGQFYCTHFNNNVVACQHDLKICLHDGAEIN